MRLLATIFLGALISIVGLGAEKEIQLRLPKPELRALFRGNTQAGEKNQSLEVREIYHTDTEAGKLIPDGVSYYIVYDPDVDASFWAPRILRSFIGFDPYLERINPDTCHLYYYTGNNGLHKETWKLSKEKGPVLEKDESLIRSEHPLNRKP